MHLAALCAPRNVAPFTTPQPSSSSVRLIYELRTGCTSQVSWVWCLVTYVAFPLSSILPPNIFYSKHKARIWVLRVRKPLSMGSLLMERVFQSTSMEFWQHILSGCRVHVQWLRHFSPTCVVHIEDCEGWWLSCCHSSVVDSLVPRLFFFFLMNGLGIWG